eukprot:3033540-Karenia_brevis.AAC.1
MGQQVLQALQALAPVFEAQGMTPGGDTRSVASWDSMDQDIENLAESDPYQGGLDTFASSSSRGPASAPSTKRRCCGKQAPSGRNGREEAKKNMISEISLDLTDEVANDINEFRLDVPEVFALHGGSDGAATAYNIVG